MKVETISDNAMVLAMVVKSADWEKGLNFISRAEDFEQVGFWGYDKGRQLAAHIHLPAERMVAKTQEVIFVKQGRVRADVFNEHGVLVASHELQAGDTAIFLNGGHGYEILENETQILEVKNGPYVGQEKDRKRI